MRALFEEMDRQTTRMGELVLRRRLDPSAGIDVYEVKLGDDFLMSSMFTVVEVELARLGIGSAKASQLDVLVGGLGLGYTAGAALDDRRVNSVTVVEALKVVIEWHERRLLPLSPDLTADPRCRFVHGDFFAAVASGEALGPAAPEQWDVVLLDIDHTPTHHLDPAHAAFYTPAGLNSLRARLRAGGVFAMWSDGAPDPAFVELLRSSFAWSAAKAVTFPNPTAGVEVASTVYLAGLG